MDPKALGQFLMQPSTADVLNTPVRRGGILPVTEYPNRTEFDLSSGLTGALMDAFTAPARAARGEISEDQQIPEAFNFAGSLTLGSLLAPRPTGSVGMGGRAAKGALDMSEAARMARASEGGWLDEPTVYHGTASDVKSFDKSKFGSSTKAAGASRAAWAVDDPRTAAGYAEYAAGLPTREALEKAATYERLAQKSKSPTEADKWWSKQDEAAGLAEQLDAEGGIGQNVMPLKVRGKLMEHDFGGAEYTDVARDVARLLRDAQAQGYDGLKLLNLADDVAMNNRPATHYAIFDPSNIRSVNAAFDPAKAGSSNLLAANAKTGAAVPLATKALEAQQPQGIRAFHGSPHDFERFDMSKIGTGEGAQAYGHGLYFAEAEDVAKAYRDTLSKSPAIDANPIFNRNLKLKNSTGSKALDDALSNALGDVDLAKADLNKTLASRPDSDLPFWVKRHEQNVAKAKEALAALDELEKSGRMGPMSPGHMYEVNIKADPDAFIDYDIPLGQQSEAVRRALDEAGLMPYTVVDQAGNRLDFSRGMPKAEAERFAAAKGGRAIPKDDADFDAVRKAQMMTGRGDAAQADIATALREAGVPGIKYLDQMSRGEGKGSSNYVVFDDNLIEILRKYGLLGPVAGGGTLAGMLMGGQGGDTY